MAEFRYVDGSSLPRYFREGLFPLVRHAFAQTRRLCKSSNFDHHWVQRHDSNAAEQWQDEQTERMSKRRRVDQGLIDLTEESEPEAEEDEGSEDDDETQAVICL
ncbi:hypothetical protein WJX82_011337 [Trebouxia sp. C0006]